MRHQHPNKRRNTWPPWSDADYKSVNNNQPWVAPKDPGIEPVLPTASSEGASTRSASKKSTEHTNLLLQHQHDVRQQDKKKTKYEKYQAGLTALCNPITRNIKEYFVSAHNNIITGFHLVNTIVLMEYIQTNYRTDLMKKLQENDTILDAQWDPTTLIAVLFTRIEDCKIFFQNCRRAIQQENIL